MENSRPGRAHEHDAVPSSGRPAGQPWEADTVMVLVAVTAVVGALLVVVALPGSALDDALVLRLALLGPAATALTAAGLLVLRRPAGSDRPAQFLLAGGILALAAATATIQVAGRDAATPALALSATAALLLVPAIARWERRRGVGGPHDVVDAMVLTLGGAALLTGLPADALPPVAPVVPGTATVMATSALLIALVLAVRAWLRVGVAGRALRAGCAAVTVLAAAGAVQALWAWDSPRMTVAAAMAQTLALLVLVLALVLTEAGLSPAGAAAEGHTASCSEPEPGPGGVAGGLRDALAMLVYLPLGAALVSAAVQWQGGSRLTTTTTMLLVMSASMAFARQLLTERENRRLADQVRMGRQTLRRQSVEDPVTGLANRSMFRWALTEALERRRCSERPVAVVLCDIEGFRGLNDGLGQAVGDLVLAEVGRRLRSGICPDRVTARIGGDEFAVLLDGLDPDRGAAWAEEMAEQLQTRVNGTCLVEGNLVSLAVAVGLVVVQPDQQVGGADEVLGRADVALQIARGALVRRPVTHHEGLTMPGARDWELRPALEQDLRAGAVTPFYQPMVDLATGRIQVFEALARWNHGGQLTGPEVFLPVATRAGLMPVLVEQVMREAATQLASWRRLPGRRDLRVAVNVSPAQIVDPSFPQLVEQVLAEAGLPAAGLIVEITEESLFDDPDAAARVIYALRRLGVTVWLDDFGAGYSSLALLHRLPLSAIKLDQSLVGAVDTDAGLHRLVTGLIQLGRDLNLDVIAEGIQRHSQAEVLAEAGCLLGQGYLYAAAEPAVATESMLRRPFGTVRHTGTGTVPAAPAATPRAAGLAG